MPFFYAIFQLSSLYLLLSSAIIYYAYLFLQPLNLSLSLKIFYPFNTCPPLGVCKVVKKLQCIYNVFRACISFVIIFIACILTPSTVSTVSLRCTLWSYKLEIRKAVQISIITSACICQS